jgi:hypothetical protein
VTLDKWLVLLGGLAAIGWVLWYFLVAGRSGAAARASSGSARDSRGRIP